MKTVFTISDLEKLSGVKKHTIRIWEKRYGLLSPQRTKTNIRYYDGDSLVQLLNIALLNKNGYKVSKIASLSIEEVKAHCKELIRDNDRVLNKMKLAMLQFNEELFDEVVSTLMDKMSFSDIYKNYFTPFLFDVGLLWQTNVINPAHEHFVSSLIKRRIIHAIGSVTVSKLGKKKFVLFLPENEIHDIPIVYLNYELALLGYKVVYIGSSISMTFLSSIKETCDLKIIFASYFTVQQDLASMEKYLARFKKEVLGDDGSEFWVLGNIDQEISVARLPESVYKFATMEEIFIKIKSD